MRGLVLLLMTLPLLGTLGACSSLRYYAQAFGGQIAVLRARQPIARLIDDPATPPALKARLITIREARDWAVGALELPDNGSYRDYVALDRPYVVWNVFAAAEFSTAALEHCFPVAGCVGYQGYYREADARASAAALARRGFDVEVSGVPAYSTLGWFDDPVLSSMLRWDDATLIATLFHELAHQKLYVKNDTRFNESFAEFVGEQGLQQYLQLHAELAPPDLQLQRRRQEQFTALVLARREQLTALYRQPLDAATMRAHKAEVLAALRQDYETLRDREWAGVGSYQRFFDKPLNNARLLPFGLYDDALPAFAALFEEADHDWKRFYVAAGALAALEPRPRQAALEALARRPSVHQSAVPAP